ncbi:MAG: hypothetical protein LBQ75_03040, partial [Zoogloeaceae bacterium]|nr:hypothetical protein [Zoogloeaceae bacterium]
MAVLIGLGAAYAQAGRAEVQVLQGKIGSAPIVMQLGISKDSYGRIAAGGRYFYRKYKTDIPLSGYGTEQGDLHLIEWAWKVDDDFGDDSDVPDGAVRARITLTPKGKGWRGTWQEKDTSKTLPVTLEPLNPAELVGARFKVSEYTSAYDIVRLTGMSLQAGEKETFMGYTLEWMEEPITKLDMFRVRDGFSDEALKRINAALEATQFESIKWYFDCQGNGGFNFEQSVTPLFLNKRLLSVSIFTDWFCGG